MELREKNIRIKLLKLTVDKYAELCGRYGIPDPPVDGVYKYSDIPVRLSSGVV
jgi:hypothetical protein